MNQNIFETVQRLADNSRVYSFRLKTRSSNNIKRFIFTKKRKTIPGNVIDTIQPRINDSVLSLEKKIKYFVRDDVTCIYMSDIGIISLCTTGDIIYFDGTAVYDGVFPYLTYSTKLYSTKQTYFIKKMELDVESRIKLLEAMNGCFSNCVVCKEAMTFKLVNTSKIEPTRPFKIVSHSHVDRLRIIYIFKHNECSSEINRCYECNSYLCDDCMKCVGPCNVCNRELYMCSGKSENRHKNIESVFNPYTCKECRQLTKIYEINNLV